MPDVTSSAPVRTFLFADVRGYTRFTQERGDEAASALAARFADTVRDYLRRELKDKPDRDELLALAEALLTEEEQPA